MGKDLVKFVQMKMRQPGGTGSLRSASWDFF